MLRQHLVYGISIFTLCGDYITLLMEHEAAVEVRNHYKCNSMILQLHHEAELKCT